MLWQLRGPEVRAPKGPERPGELEPLEVAAVRGWQTRSVEPLRRSPESPERCNSCRSTGHLDRDSV
jgi:hypothetical protein